MTKKTKTACAKEADQLWLAPYRAQFNKTLAKQGYSIATLRTYDTAARLFCVEVDRRGLARGELKGSALSNAHASALAAMHPNKYDQKRYCLERFIGTLVEAGVAVRPVPKKKALTALDRLQAEYESYLRDQRGVTDATIYH